MHQIADTTLRTRSVQSFFDTATNGIALPASEQCKAPQTEDLYEKAAGVCSLCPSSNSNNDGFSDKWLAVHGDIPGMNEH